MIRAASSPGRSLPCHADKFLMTRQGQIIGKVEGAIAWDDPAVIRQLVTMLAA